jgi:hypothetical protein
MLQNKQHFACPKAHIGINTLFMRKTIVAIACMLALQVQGQPPIGKGKQNIIKNGWSLLANPLGILEPRTMALGLGVGYTLKNRWQASAELSYLTNGIHADSRLDNVSGLRGIFSLKRFSRSAGGFWGIEGRIKHFGFDSKWQFVNKAIQDTLNAFSHRSTHAILGMAAFGAYRLRLSKNGDWQLECLLGFGARFRFISRRGLPPGYVALPDRGGTGLRPKLQQEGGTAYVPCAIRVVYQLSK